METVSSRRQYSLKQRSDSRVRTSLLDNWHHHVLPMDLAPRNRPNVLSQDVNQLAMDTITSFNINEDDLDCPGHAQHLSVRARNSEGTFSVCLATSSSSEGFYDSGEDDRKIRAMSVDEFHQMSRCNDDSNNNTLFTLHPSEENSLQWDLDIETPTVQLPQLKRKRRASLDEGVQGMLEGRRSAEDTVTGEWRRNALTEPGTPAEPCTPVASCVSLEQLLADSHYLIQKLQPILCAERVNQMTRTHSDIEAVTSLLEEKERDLELAARIGQTLLSKNKDLSSRKEALEEQLSLANDTVKQLRHELTKKVQQLEVYDQDLQNQNPQDDGLGVGVGEADAAHSAVEKLQRRVGTLEEENLHLLQETAQLRSDTETYEEKEKKLVKDSLQQFVELTQKVDSLTEELQRKKKENSHQKDEIGSLVAQLNEVCQRVRKLTEENTDLLDKLQAVQESQTQLSRELGIQKDKYDELFETLERTQEQLRSRSHRSSKSRSCSLDAGSMDSHSLASELQQSLNLELSLDDENGINKSYNWRVFETARAAHKAARKSRSNSMRMSSSASSCWDAESLAASVPNSDTESLLSDGYSGDLDSVCGSMVELGRPGIPGSNDLQTALQRLASKQEDFNRTPHDQRSEGVSPFRMPGTPDTVSSSSSGYSYLGCSKNPQSSSSSSHYKMSSKLQIVKPMEGSVTLQQWQRLAQPHLGGLFERREGVKVKGERKLDLEEEAYTLSDYEEDDDALECLSGLTENGPSQRWSPPFTSSANHSHRSLPIPLTPSSRPGMASAQPVASSTPHSRPGSERSSGSSSSYTMSLGLAALLQDRDTSLARAVMKTSASCPKVSARSGASTPVPMIPAESVATASAGTTPAPVPRPGQRNPPTENPGLLGKLISSGYSLLWNKSDVPGPSAPSAPPSVRCHDPVLADSAQDPAKKPNDSQVFPSGGSGVLGAITTLRKNGIL